MALQPSPQEWSIEELMAVTSQDQPVLRGQEYIREKRAWTWYRLSEGLTPYLLVAPLLILITIFIFWPLVYSMYLSFFDWNFVRPDKTFVGWDNFTRLPDDPRFIRALRGTLFYTVTLVPLQVFLPLALALLLWPIRRS
jgi:ABC-type sugar transport system permease subunit